MVEFSIREFFFVLLVIPFILCGIAGVWRRVAEWRTEAQMRRSLMRCRYCGAPFLPSGALSVENCPSCGQENLAGRDRRLG